MCKRWSKSSVQPTLRTVTTPYDFLKASHSNRTHTRNLLSGNGGASRKNVPTFYGSAKNTGVTRNHLISCPIRRAASCPVIRCQLRGWCIRSAMGPVVHQKISLRDALLPEESFLHTVFLLE